MMLIADGGSTKCDWVLLDQKGEVILRTQTKGLNPSVVEKEELKRRIKVDVGLREIFAKVKSVDFYGAGCGTQTPREILKEILSSVFTGAIVTVEEDMLAAALSVTQEPGIVCILGTGSNSCLFDGKKTISPIASLGYILMDEASGNYFGKLLLRDYFYGKMPSNVAAEFEKRYNPDADQIKINLYQRPNPNAYLASFAEFLFSQNANENYIINLIKKGVMEFIECRVLCFSQAKDLPVHFVGSIAWFSGEIIRQCLRECELAPGNFIQRPIDGLISYYRKYKLPDKK